MRGAGQGAFLRAKLHIKSRKKNSAKPGIYKKGVYRTYDLKTIFGKKKEWRTMSYNMARMVRVSETIRNVNFGLFR